MIYLTFDRGNCPMDFAGDGCPNSADCYAFDAADAELLRASLQALADAETNPFKTRVYRRAVDLINDATDHERKSR
jgi:hypothetical protein